MKNLNNVLILPVIPIPTLSIGVLCEVGSKIEAGLSRFTPRTLAGVGKAFTTCLSPVKESESRVEKMSWRCLYDRK